MAIDASSYVSDNSAYTITCADATGVDADKMTVTRSTRTTNYDPSNPAHDDGCTFTVDPVDTLPATAPPGDPTAATQGATTFSVVFTSDGGHSITRTISVNIGPDSSLTFTAPSTFTLGRNRTLEINALAATSGENAAYTVSCADATGVDANKMTVTRSTRTANYDPSNPAHDAGCSFTVDPLDTLATGSQGDTTFSVAFTSTGGATASGTFTVNIGPDSTIAYTAPTGLLIGRNRTLSVDLSSAATDGSYTVTCGDATNVDRSKLVSVTRANAQTSPCVFTVTPLTTAAPGTARFRVPLTSSGRATETGVVSLTVGQDSTIVFTAPDPALKVGINRTRVIDALDYVRRDGNYTITCADPTSVDSTKLTSVARDSSGNGCSYTISPDKHADAVAAGRCDFHYRLQIYRRALHQRSLHHRGRPGFHHRLHRSCRGECLDGRPQPHPDD